MDATIGGKSLHFDIRATNFYRREDGEWKIVHHHTDPDGPLQQALESPEPTKRSARADDPSRRGNPLEKRDGHAGSQRGAAD